MSKRGIWGSAVRVFRRFAVRFVGQSRAIRQENRFAVARPTNGFRTVHVDLGGGIADFEKFTKAMRIGDRVRAFCEDGVIEAEKISQTRFKLIYKVETTGSIH